MCLEKLREFPKTKTLVIVTTITFIPFVLLTAVFVINEYRLESITGYGLLALELSWTSDMVDKIFTAWGPEEIKRQATMHYLDYLFIPFYVLFGMGLILIISRKLGGRVGDIGLVIAFLILIAGIFDALENINLLLMLGDRSYISSITSFLASLFATFKITFLVAGLFFFLIVIISLITQKFQKR